MKKSVRQKVLDAVTWRRTIPTQAVAKAAKCSDNTAWVSLRRLEANGLVRGQRVGRFTLWIKSAK